MLYLTRELDFKVVFLKRSFPKLTLQLRIQRTVLLIAGKFNEYFSEMFRCFKEKCIKKGKSRKSCSYFAHLKNSPNILTFSEKFQKKKSLKCRIEVTCA